MSSNFVKNLFYAPLESWNHQEKVVELKDQEAQHISRVLRHKIGEEITVADGNGAHWRTEIASVTNKSVVANLVEANSKTIPQKKKIIAFGAIKKRDRLEFAIEKAVELGAWEICIFDADHSERSRINEQRINTQIITAFKQSCRFYLPKLIIMNSLNEVLDHYSIAKPLMAYLGDQIIAKSPTSLKESQNLLLVGPEGGFSEKEAILAKQRNADFIQLGDQRLRAETAVIAFLAQYIFSD